MIKPIELMIVGAQKSGTSSLLRYLAQHRDIHTHREVPELMFFVNDNQYREGYEKIFLRYFGECPNDKVVVLAKSAMLVYSPEALERLYQHNPEMQVVVMLRHPVNRCYSAYWQARRKGWESLKTFEKALAAEEGRLQEGWLKWHDCCYAHNSIYYPHVKRLLEVFGRERVTIFFAEDMRDESKKMCREIFAKVNLNPDVLIEVERVYNPAGIPRSELLARTFHKAIFSENQAVAGMRNLIPQSVKNQTKNLVARLNSKQFEPPPILPETRALLLNRFKEANQQLSELLMQDLSHWNK